MFDDLNDAAKAIKGLCDRISTVLMHRIELVLGEVKRLIANIRDMQLPQIGLVVDEVRQRAEEAKGVLTEGEATLANAKAITSHLAEGRWVDAHIETETSKYHIRVRLDREEE